MVRLHSLQRMDEESFALEIYRSIFGNDASLCTTSRPESMSHGTPRMLWIRAKVAFAIHSYVEPRCRSRDCHIHYTCFIGDRFDCIGCAIFTKGYRTTVGMEAKFFGVEVRAIEGIGGP